MNKLSLILLLFVSCYDSGNWDLRMNEYNVRYVVSGSAESVDITLSNYYGNIEQYDNIPVPYEYSFSKISYDPCKTLYASAQINGYGDIIIEIYVNYELIETAEASGEHNIASCSGIVDVLECH